MLIQKEEEIEKLKGRSPLHRSPKMNTEFENAGIAIASNQDQALVKKLNEVEKDKVKETLNYDYIKNVFVKYLVYQANANEKEAMTLEKVLFTVLKATENDISMIEKARDKNTGGLLSYFYAGGHPSVPRPIKPRISFSDTQ